MNRSRGMCMRKMQFYEEGSLRYLKKNVASYYRTVIIYSVYNSNEQWFHNHMVVNFIL